MPKVSLLTDWVTVATSGATVDGREISAIDLQEMAASYDPGEYTAVINSDHCPWYGNFGSVAKLRIAKDSKSRVVLDAQISPNKNYLNKNADGNSLFFSVEILRNFCGSGKAYLAGLAITDTPASVGTTMVQFSKDNTDKMTVSDWLQGDVEYTEAHVSTDGLLKKIYNKICGESAQPQEEENMTKEELSAGVSEQLKPIVEKIASINTAIDALTGSNASMPLGMAALKSAIDAMGAKLEANLKSIDTTNSVSTGVAGELNNLI